MILFSTHEAVIGSEVKIASSHAIWRMAWLNRRRKESSSSKEINKYRSWQDIVMNKNTAAIIAFLLTDGSVSFGKKYKNAEIALDSTSEVLHREFARLMRNELGLTAHRSGIKSRAYSFEVANNLVKYTGGYRTKQYTDGSYPQTKIPDEIKNADENVLLHFLKYAFTCDGSAGLSIQKSKHTKNCWFFQKRIQLACKHPALLTDFQELLNKIGIHSRISVEQGKLLIDNRNGIESFCSKIGFIDGVKISGKGNSVWKGLEKNDILRIYEFLYNVSDSLGSKRFDGGFWMKNFQTKEEIIDFMKNDLLSRQGPGKLGKGMARRMQSLTHTLPNGKSH